MWFKINGFILLFLLLPLIRERNIVSGCVLVFSTQSQVPQLIINQLITNMFQFYSNSSE